MNDRDDVTEEFRDALRVAVEQDAAREVDWPAFHATLNGGAVAAVLAELRRRASGGYRATAAAGAAWWDYAARAALATVPLGLAAALLLFVYLRSGPGRADDSMPVIATVASAPPDAASARAAFESVLIGDAAPSSVKAALIPAPAEAFPADSSGGDRK
ncbi:MAG: hypothetical protein ACREN6_15170 [Gemmatimonadaceae bacterium]